MLSESQERMLIIVHKGREEEVKRIFDKWDLPWSEIGFVTDTGRMVVKHHGKVVADIPAKKIADESPVYQRESQGAGVFEGSPRVPAGWNCRHARSPTADLKKLLAWPTIASKNWVYRQYDHMVRDGSVVCPGSDAAVLRIKADSLPDVERRHRRQSHAIRRFTEKLIALTVDCNGAYVYLDPYEGGKDCDGRGVPQSGLFRRGAAGHDRQSQHAQPAQAGVVLADEGIRARPGRRVQGVQRARHRRQLLALQPKPGRPD